MIWIYILLAADPVDRLKEEVAKVLRRVPETMCRNYVDGMMSRMHSNKDRDGAPIG